MQIPTLLRLAEHKALRTISLDGKIVDLGGDARAEYRSCIGGTHEITTVNFDEKTRPDLMHNLERPLPIPDASYDHALLVNVLEHIYEYQQLLRETARILRPGGSVIIVVPFLFPLHPSPRDFWRFSNGALRLECEKAGLTVEKVSALGSGVFAARFVMLDRLMPAPIRFIGYGIRPFVGLADRCFNALGHRIGKKYRPADYALGYMAKAKKR